MNIGEFSNGSLGETPMTGFHNWRYRCERVGWDLGCGHEESDLMHDMKPFYVRLHSCMEYDMMLYVIAYAY